MSKKIDIYYYASQKGREDYHFESKKVSSRKT